MLSRRIEDVPAEEVKVDGAKDVTMRIMVGRGDGAPNFAMRCFTVQPGGHTPRHSHNYEHEVYVLAGRGRAEHDGTLREIGAGDVLLVEPNKVHQFVNNGEAPLQFLCLVPISFDCGGEMKATPGS